MKAQILEEREKLILKEVKTPSPKEGEILIRVKACAICGTDVKVYHHGHRLITFPRITGHEVAGEIVEVGEGVESFKEGDRVSVAPAVPCRNCYYCWRGEQAMCQNLRAIGYYWDGGFAEYMLVPQEAVKGGCVNKLPPGIDFCEGALAEPLACAINAQELTKVKEGDTVVIIGGGPLGALHSQLARARGVEKVILVEISPHRLKMVKRVAGADIYLNPQEEDLKEKVTELTQGRGADQVIVACSSPEAQKLALEIVAPLGWVNFFGGLPKDKPYVNLDTNLIHYKECFVTGTHGSSPLHNRMALEVISKGKVKVRELISQKLPLEKLPQGLELVERGEVLKVIIEP